RGSHIGARGLLRRRKGRGRVARASGQENQKGYRCGRFHAPSMSRHSERIRKDPPGFLRLCAYCAGMDTSPRIVVVEDERAMREMLVLAFEREGYRVAALPTGAGLTEA